METSENYLSKSRLELDSLIDLKGCYSKYLHLIDPKYHDYYISKRNKAIYRLCLITEELDINGNKLPNLLFTLFYLTNRKSAIKNNN